MLRQLALWGSVGAFYLPGVAPRNYEEGEPVQLKVVKLDSVKTQLDYDYYSLPFCQPSTITEAAENLGEILSGDMIETSAYEISMKTTEMCKILCNKTYEKKDLQQFEERIRDDYAVNWIVDNLPSASTFFLTDDTGAEEMIYEKGFPLGYVGGREGHGGTDKDVFLNNHVRIILSYHTDPSSFIGHRIVGFQVEAFSVKHKVLGAWNDAKTKLATCTPASPVGSEARPAQLVTGNSENIIFTYDVQWKESPIKWASRWDMYLKMTDGHIHWFAIINSIVIVLFLSMMIAMILLRTLYQDLRKYNEIDLTAAEQQEETGWKLVHGEVFRPPEHAGFFSTLIGSGAQIFAMTLSALLFACLGFLSPANRGGLMTALLLLFVFMGMLAGYYGTRMYKMFNLTNWKTNALRIALFFPGTIFGGFFFLNLFVWGKKSSGAAPFGTLCVLVVLWLGISAPLVYLGSYLAFKKPAIEAPLRVNNIPRALPQDTPWYGSFWVTVMTGGLLPFGAVFMELFFIMSSVWMHQFYYVFGILGIVFIILIITCAEISILLCYFQLCHENYHWWWRSFFSSGSAAFYLFGYSIWYFATKLDITDFVSGLLFFGYMFLVSFTFFILTGTIGHVACYYFVRKIYSSVKIE